MAELGELGRRTLKESIPQGEMRFVVERMKCSIKAD